MKGRDWQPETFDVNDVNLRLSWITPHEFEAERMAFLFMDADASWIDMSADE